MALSLITFSLPSFFGLWAGKWFDSVQQYMHPSVPPSLHSHWVSLSPPFPAAGFSLYLKYKTLNTLLLQQSTPLGAALYYQRLLVTEGNESHLFLSAVTPICLLCSFQLCTLKTWKQGIWLRWRWHGTCSVIPVRRWWRWQREENKRCVNNGHGKMVCGGESMETNVLGWVFLERGSAGV